MPDTDLNTLFPTDEQVPQEFSQDLLAKGNRILINGKIRDWDGPTRPIESPVMRRVGRDLHSRTIGQGSMLTRRQALDALDAAYRAYDQGQGNWPRLPLRERIACARKFIDSLAPLRERVALAEMWEIAKAYQNCLNEFDRTLRYIKGTLEAAEEFDHSACRPCSTPDTWAVVNRAPLGVTLVMGPFNVPVFETLCTAIPALVMGNTVIIKLPRLGVLPILEFLPAMAECFPPGVVNVIDGDGQTLITPIMETGQISVLTFIGSARVAGIIRKHHPHPTRLRKVLGLDAKNPAIVFPDADIDRAVEQVVSGALKFNGQRCTAIKQVYVHREIEKQFLERLCRTVDKKRLGMPWSNPDITPLAEPDKAGRLAKLLEDALSKGAKVANSGGEFAGSLFRPAVLHPVDAAMEVFHVEQFGPVIPVAPFDDPQQVVSAILPSEYGQQASLFGRDTGVLGEMIDRLSTQFSRINLNSYCRRGPDTLPFTGRKDSAESVLSVRESLRTFSSDVVISADVDQGDLMEELADRGCCRYLK